MTDSTPTAAETSAPPGQTMPSAFPASFAQTRLWLVEQIEPGQSTYLIPVGLRLKGRLNLPALESALATLLSRHEALRTSLQLQDGELYQCIHPTVPLPWAIEDFSCGSSDEAIARVRQRMREESSRPFHLDHAPLWRARLFRLGPEDHRLLVVMHHCISDAWSLNLFQQELAEAYRRHASGQPVAFPELPIQYADYSVWQREILEGETCGKQLAAWKERLAGIPPLLALPTDRPRNPAPSHEGGRCHWRMSDLPCSHVRRFCREQGVTEFMVFLAALSAILYRQSGQSDFVVGTPVVARSQIELEGVIGFFLSTLPLRCDVGGNPSFLDLLHRALDTVTHAFANQDIPFEKLVEELHPERSTEHTPVFQVFLNLISTAATSTAAESWAELQVESLEPESVTSKFDLTLYVQSAPDSLEFDLVYRQDLFSEARMRSFARQFEVFLESAMATPSIRVLELPLPPPEGLPDPAAPLPPPRGACLIDATRQQARLAPSSVAIEDAWGHWTYRDLESRSNQLAHYLLTQGIGRGHVVAIHAVRGGALVCAMLSVLKCGAAFWIADASYPGTVLASRARRLQPRAWIRLKEAGGFPIELESTGNSGGSSPLPRVLVPAGPGLGTWPARACSDQPPAVPIDPQQPAYVLFTSGSTGEPKAVVTAHQPVAHFVAWQIEHYRLSSQDRFSQLSGIGHDPFLRDVFTPLSLGATACVPSPLESDLTSWHLRARITVSHLTPGVARVLAQPGTSSPTTRLLFLGGDQVRTDDLQRLRRWAPQARVVNFYGTTETPQAVAGFEVPLETNDAPLLDPVPLGHGIAGAQLLVLNPCHRLAGVGELGEIHVRSAHLSLGYFEDPKSTQERFVANPITGQATDLVYRTGDLGRYRPDGAVVFAGRSDRQVKIRGYRVEPGAIEAAIQRHPRIRCATVQTQVAPDGELELVAYYVPEDGGPEPEVLRAFLSTQLAPFEVPRRLMRLDHLPLNRHGKIDRHALEKMAPVTTSESLQRDAAPRTETERRLSRLWAEVLQRDAVGIHSDFFELGGHSLLGLRLLERVHAEFQTPLTLRTLFECRTVADMARRLDASLFSDGETVPQPPAAQLRGATRGVPLFVVPGYFGIGYMRPSLAVAIGGVCPYYDRFRYAGVGDQRAPNTTIETIAEHLIRQLELLWPRGSGPLCLAGFSFGGLVAFEMSRQLHQQGVPVPLVLLYDTRMRGGLRARSKAGVAWELLRRAGRQPSGQRIAFIRRMISAKLARLRRLPPAAALETKPSPEPTTPRPPPGVEPEVQPEVRRTGLVNEAVRVASIRAGMKYRPATYPGRVVLFKATEELANEWLRLELDQFNGWRPFVTGELEVVKIPRHHLGIYTEPLHPLVLDRTLQLLREVQPPNPPL